MKSTTIEKIRKVKALQGLTIGEVCALPRFRDNMAGYIKAQVEMRASYLEACKKMNIKPQAHAVDKVPHDVETFTAEYLECLCGFNKRPAGQREYILQLGTQAYGLTVSQYAVEQYPELKDELLPAAQ